MIPDAEIIVVGGGAVGFGVAYALAKAGQKDILLLERAEDIGTVTTAQGAGLCGQVRDTVERIHLAMHSVATFRELQADPVAKPDWNEVGSLRLALTEPRAAEFKRMKQAADAAGLATEFLTAKEGEARWPGMNLGGATAILWCPSDGYMTPRSVVNAYAHQCRQRGVRIATSTAVESLRIADGRLTGVVTNQGTARCRYLINAAGAHAHHIAKLAGLHLPIVPVRHEYFVSVAMPGLTPGHPCFRIPELTLYGRVRDGGLLLGGWEPRSLHTDPNGYDLQGQPPEIATDWPVLNQFEESFATLFPSARGVKKKLIGKGWPTFTPDGRFLIGESSRVKGFVMAGGCNAHGISGSGGMGKLLVESLLNPEPSPYVRSLSPDRFTETKWSWAQACRDAARIYETYYGV
jgi:glycine/D-amino acid oxidase-like deaminating enzyme